MALLGTGSRSRERAAGVGVLSSTLALAGCVLYERLTGGEARLAFSHEQHVLIEELECVVCHDTAWVSDEPGMPAQETCSICHDVLDDGKPPERQVASLFADGVIAAARVSALDDEVIFRHLRHVSAGVACGDCHRGIERNQRVDVELAPTMRACVDCHVERGQAHGCEICHQSVGMDVAPASHGHNWMRLHGVTVRSGCTRTADNCELCHTESTCTACHLEQPPESHTNYFRRRGHGLLASMDRSSCAACHRSDSCDRCHSETLPASHTGQWGAPLATHCLACHFPLSAEGCSTCHAGSPSHSLGAPKPPDHNAAMNCRQCHGLTAPLPHVDNGSNCNLCHP